MLVPPPAYGRQNNRNLALGFGLWDVIQAEDDAGVLILYIDIMFFRIRRKAACRCLSTYS